MRALAPAAIAALAPALALFAAAPTRADEAAPPSLLEIAAYAAQERAEPGQRWAFTRTITRGAEPLVARFDPSAPEDARWTLVAPEAEEALSKEQRAIFRDLQKNDAPDNEVVLGADGEPFVAEEAFGTDIRLVREDASEAVFGFTPTDGVSMAGGEGEEREERDVSAFLSGEVVVAKDEPAFRTMHIFAPSSFKPHPIARVTKLDVVITFGETEPGGPMALVSMDNEVAGRALFQAFEQSFQVVNSDFVRVDGPPFPSDEDE